MIQEILTFGNKKQEKEVESNTERLLNKKLEEQNNKQLDAAE